MRSSSRGIRYAVVGFVLISLVAIGGMSWATASSWRLAKWNQNENQLNKIREAVGRLDNYVLGILKREAGREYTDYRTWYTPDKICTGRGVELDPRDYLVPSPIALTKPRHDWIELYVEVNANGEWSSPHLPGENWNLIDSDNWNQAAINRARKTLAWLRSTFTVVDFERALTAAMDRERELTGTTEEFDEEEKAAPGSPEPSIVGAAARATWNDPRAQTMRNRVLRGSQRSYLPDPKCVPADIAEGMAVSPGAYWIRESSDDSLSATTEIRYSTLAPFFLGADPDGNLKLAFVRTVRTGFDVVHQGFIADWRSLKTELLRRIQDVFPKPDLEPIFAWTDEELEDAELDASQMQQMPVRLKVAGIAPSLAADAWRSVGWLLLICWTAAMAVFLAAAWGIRNLVALTARRLQFAYAVTHELRTPLTTFRLYTDMLAARLVPEESQQEYLDTLNRESQRLSSLVEDVLEYARLENQKLRLNPIPTEGKLLLSRLSEYLEMRCKVNGITAKTRNEVPEGQFIRTDVDLVSQIAGVLVNNACRHARQSKEPTVFLRLGADNGHLQMDVVDSGPGVDRADSRQIFKPFRRGRNADATAQGGVGLGLSLARNWAALLGGRLDLVARHDPQFGGAHFRLTIPSEINE